MYIHEMYAMSENMGMVQKDCNPLVNIKFHGCSSPQICRRRTSTASGISRYIGAPGHTAGFAHGTQAFFLHVMSGGGASCSVNPHVNLQRCDEALLVRGWAL